MFCEARGGGVTFYKGFKRGDVPRVEGGSRFFKGSKRGVKKNPVNRNENLQTPLLIKNNTSLTAERPATDGNEMPHVVM